MFYGKYFYQAVLKIPGIYTYREVNRYQSLNLFTEYLDNRKSYNSKHNSWAYRNLIGADPKQIYTVHQTLQKFKGDVRVRTEKNKISICTVTEEKLLEVLTTLKAKGLVINIFQPASEEAAEKIKDGILFVGSDPKLKFRAMIRSKRYNSTVRTQIANYVDNYEGTILMSDYLKQKLRKPATVKDGDEQYISGYFYVDNMEALMFLQLISPTFVGKIFPLETHVDK